MLKKKGKGKEDTLTYSSSVVAANAARKFKSVDEIRKYADQLAKSEDVEKQIDEINELASEYQRLVAPYYKYGASSFDVFDDSMKALSKSMTVNADSTAPKLKRALESLDFENVPDDVIETGVKVANALKHAATQYFEAKPQRAVRIEEFAGAVVPKGTNPELINRLKEAGLQVEEYDKTVPGSRRAAGIKTAPTLSPFNPTATEEFHDTKPTASGTICPKPQRQNASGQPVLRLDGLAAGAGLWGRNGASH